LNLTDPSGLVWLRLNKTDSYYWVDDDVYEKNKKDYKNYTPSNDTIIRVTGGNKAGSDQIGQFVVLSGDGNAYTMSEFDLALGTVHDPGPSPIQELIAGSETVLWWGRPFVYALTACMLPAAAPGAVAGGGSAAGGAYIGLGLRAAATVGPGAGAALTQLGGKDQQIMNLAVELGARGNASWLHNVTKVTEATIRIVPTGQLHNLGSIGGNPIMGSLISKVGIVEMNGVTYIVRMVGNQPQILGPLP
jgi:hypothetical protein